MFEQAQRAPPTRALEPRLQRVHFAHPEGDAPRHRHSLLRLAQCAIAGLEYRLWFMPALRRERFDLRGDRPVKQQRVEKSRRHRLVFDNTPISILQALDQQILDQASRMLLEIAIDHREQHREQAVLAQHAVTLGAVAREEHFRRLIEQSRRRHARQQAAQLRDWRGAVAVDLETQLGLETRGAQHAHRVLSIAGLGVANQPQPPRLNVGQAADVIPDREIGDVVIEGIDREIAAPDVLVDIAVHVVAQQPTVIVLHAVSARTLRGATAPAATAVGSRELLRRLKRRRGLQRIVCTGSQFVGQQFGLVFLAVRHRLFARRRRAGSAESCDFNDLAAIDNVGQSEPAPDQATVAEQPPHLVRQGIRGDVEILGVAPEDDVAHAAAHQERLESCLLEAVQDPQRVRGNFGPRNRMIGARNDARRTRRRGRSQVLVQINPDLA